MLTVAPTTVAIRAARAARSGELPELGTARARLRASEAELEEARAAHRQDPSALTKMEVDFWTTTVRRDARAVEKAEFAAAISAPHRRQASV